jgi:hypothetical protein
MSKFIKVTIDKDKFFDAKKWAKQTFGRSNPNKGPWSDMVWYAHHHFYFSVPEHATMFMLRWM